MDDVPIFLRSEDINDIQIVLSVVFASLPTNFGEFIKWVIEVSREEDGASSLNTEEKGRLIVKEEVLKQVQETRLLKHVTEWSSSSNSCYRNIPSLGDKDSLHDTVANNCCQGAKLLTENHGSLDKFFRRSTCVKCLKANGHTPVAVASGTVVMGSSKPGVDMLVSLSKTLSCSGSAPVNCIGTHSGSNDVLTALLLALPPQTWSGIKEEKPFQEICSLVSTESLSP